MTLCRPQLLPVEISTFFWCNLVCSGLQPQSGSSGFGRLSNSNLGNNFVYSDPRTLLTAGTSVSFMPAQSVLFEFTNRRFYRSHIRPVALALYISMVQLPMRQPLPSADEDTLSNEGGWSDFDEPPVLQLATSDEDQLENDSLPAAAP